LGVSRADVAQFAKSASDSEEEDEEEEEEDGDVNDDEEEEEEEEHDDGAATAESLRTPRKRKAEDPQAPLPREKTVAAIVLDEDEGHEGESESAPEDASGRAKRVRKSAEEKRAILQFVEDGGTHVAAAEKFGVSRTAVTKMVKERDVILGRAHEDAASAAALEGTVGSAPAPLDASALTAAPDSPAPSSPLALVDTGGAVFTPSGSSTALKRERESGLSPPLAASGGRKGKRVRKTNVEKLEILAFVEQGGSQGAAAEKFGVSRTAVTKMVKEKEAISAQATSGSTTHRKVLQYQHKLSIIEDMLYKWQVQVEFEAPSLKVTGELLQAKAMEFRNKILNDFSADLPDDVVVSLTDFKASNGWLHRYTQRRNVRSLSKHEHHSVAADPAHVDKRMEKIRKQLALAHVPLQCIWNLDEAALRHRTTASRADAPVNLDPRSQERLTVTFCVSAAGEKLALQAIGAASEPASLKAVDPVAAFGVSYHGQRKACQDSSTIMHFVNLMNQEARSRKQVWFILLDNCPSHMAAASILDPSGTYEGGFKVDAVVLLVLPPSSVGSLQPLQLGVIRSFKVAFRREMLRTLAHEFAAWETVQQPPAAAEKPAGAADAAFDVHAVTHTRNALQWLQSAWSSLSATSIRQAWAKSNYLPSHLLPELSEDVARPLDSAVYAEFVELLALLSTKRALLTALGLAGVGDTEQVAMELIGVDDPEGSGASNDDVNDDEIVMESLSAQGLLRESQRVTQQGLLLDAVPDIASISDACATVEKLLRFMDKSGNEQVLPATDRRGGRSSLLSLHRILLKARAKERSSTAYTV
ncbi:hypothetical protein PybrP1_002393, partial [[Pythium] brassicae (nom. inval.)]